MLRYLDRDQIKLSFYSNNLNYSLRKNQTYILNTLLLNKESLVKTKKLDFKEIDKYVKNLDKFLKKHPNLPTSFGSKLKTIEKRVHAYKSVQISLIEAIQAENRLDVEDALIGYNAIADKFSEDIINLIELGNANQYQQIYLLESENTRLSYILMFSFLLAILLISLSIIKFNALNNSIQKQLQRAENAERGLKKVQEQLLKYNDDLEEEITKKTQEIHEKIYTNFLSGLPNRNKLLDDIPIQHFTKIAILNIDKFQSFNDVYGEEVGNIALQLSAQFLTLQSIEYKLSLYHIGGDEFVLSCKGDVLTEDIFIQHVTKILLAFKAEHFHYEEKEFQFMMSAGIAFGKNKKLLAYADMALKDAKKKNIQLSLYNIDNTLEKTHKDDIECANKLKFALKEDKVLSYFQPITPIQEGSNLPQKYESLVRIEFNDVIIPPFRFLDVAKSNRIYYKVTKHVIDNTLSTIEKYKIASSLNFSLLDIDNEQTMKYFFDIIHTFKYNELLTVELLETEDFQNYDAVYNFCVKVRTFGIKIALDDFGSGYSNFSHILNLPVDYIKIDASLISNIDRDHNSRIMVETIVELAHKIHVLTIAEFVSSKEILDVITEVGVDYAQGYYLGKPAPIEEHLEGVEV